MRFQVFMMIRVFLATMLGFVLGLMVANPSPFGPDEWQVQTAYDADKVLILLDDGKLKIAVGLTVQDASDLADSIKFECKNVEGSK